MMTVAGRALDSHPRAGSGDSAYHEGDGDLPSACAEARPGILILGVGNILQKDDGIGVRVIERLMATDVSPRAELLDGGTAGMDLLSEVIGREKVVVVDAVRGGGAPGAVYRFAPESVEEEPYPITSLHQIGLLEVLLMARHLGRAPKQTVIFGIEPKQVDWGLGLSPEVAAVLPRVADMVLAEVGGTVPPPSTVVEG